MKGRNQVEKLEGGKGNQVSGNLIHRCNTVFVDCNTRQSVEYVQETANVIRSYGDQIISIQQPDLSPPNVPTKEKKFAGYFKIAR